MHVLYVHNIFLKISSAHKICDEHQLASIQENQLHDIIPNASTRALFSQFYNAWKLSYASANTRNNNYIDGNGPRHFNTADPYFDSQHYRNSQFPNVHMNYYSNSNLHSMDYQQYVGQSNTNPSLSTENFICNVSQSSPTIANKNSQVANNERSDALIESIDIVDTEKTKIDESLNMNKAKDPGHANAPLSETKSHLKDYVTFYSPSNITYIFNFEFMSI